MLRKHQAEMLDICRRIRAGAPIRDIYVLVTPGGGKSALPAIAGSILIPSIAEALCWVAPRTALQRQGEQNFLDPFFRELLGHRLTIRASTNEPNPCRGENGFITTYQAIGVDEHRTVAADFRQLRYILVMDEYHHAEEDSKWHAALAEMVELAAVRIYMTGTLERGNKKKIAFTPYRKIWDDGQTKAHQPAIGQDPRQAVIRYTRADALEERAILPLRFSFFDGQVRWKAAGQHHEAVLSEIQQSNAAAAIYTALNTEYAKDLLGRGFEHWAQHKARVPSAALLVVTSGIAQAKMALAFLKKRWLRAEIATSHESAAAHAAIAKFRTGALDVLVTIAMAYEGLDVKAVSHIIVLTHIRSTPWIEQCVARAVRIDPAAGPYESQVAYIFAPDDALLRQVCARIEAEQIPIVRQRMPMEQMDLFGEGGGGAGGGVVPLGGQITGSRDFAIGKLPVAPPTPLPKTPSEEEAALKQQIESHVRAYATANYYKPQRINAEIRQRFGKPRGEMNRAELARCLVHVRQVYPMNGTGRPAQGASAPRRHKRLFPAKPVAWRAAW